jgi:hypothetical protein
MHDDRQSSSVEQLSRSVVAEVSEAAVDPPAPVVPPAARVPPLPPEPPRDIVPPASAITLSRLVRPQQTREKMAEETRKKSR